MTLSDKNILIVGQGLAGTVLSYKLWQEEISHKVLDNKHKNAATPAAAGIINPITGRNYVKSWRIDQLLPAVIDTYASIGKHLNASYYREINILRSLHTPAQQNKWYSAVDKPGYSDYIDEQSEKTDYDDITVQAKAYGEVQKSLQVDIGRIAIDYRQFLIDNDMYLHADLDYSDIVVNTDGVVYSDQQYDLVIFCEGYRAIHNPFFDPVNFRPAKGEAFTIKIDREQPDKILRDDIFIAPIADQKYWTGGTYVWKFEDDSPTETFRSNWTEKLDSLIKIPYEIIDHKAGVRPSTKDRRPFLGISKDSDSIYMFNGMGTKGTSLVPYWAEHLIAHFRDDIPLDPEVDIRRFDPK